MIYTAIMIYLIIALAHVGIMLASEDFRQSLRNNSNPPLINVIIVFASGLAWPRWHYEVIRDWRKND